MRVLTLTQPWASLMAMDAKRIETRSWSTPYRGLVAIHAAKGFPKDAQRLCLEEPFRSQLVMGGIQKISDLPRGKVLCVVELVDCISTNNLGAILGTTDPLQAAIERDDEGYFGNYDADRCCWLTRGVRRLVEPVEAKGQLGLWTPTDDLMGRIRRQMEAAR